MFLRWLSQEDYLKTQAETLRKRHGSSGTWLLRTEEFRRWEETDGASLLWCHGPPGAGKTILASITQEHIRAKFDNDKDIGIAFVYFSYRDEHMSPSLYLASIIKQLFARFGHLPDDVEAEYDSYYQQDRKPTYQYLLNLLGFVIKQFRQTYLMLDALDELKQRSDMLNLLRCIAAAKKYSAYDNVKAFVTSRKEIDITRVFKGAPIVLIEAKNVRADITAFVNSEMKRCLEEEELQVQDPAIIPVIKRTLIENSDGMYVFLRKP
ncbi:hypothetical protein K440DRAFT_604401 [Wilcoxina mikolae CBS 423.85]|nr:hypothetical protein K440DRAFT_604401 [Wilcoxina mikolae CBS 423.85]